MPQLTARFGPMPFSVVLDGSGNGTVTFQPNGSNARVTNLFVKVSDVTAQAVCTIYRGQMDDVHAINVTQSGSTGAAATGVIDVQDGETLYVRWVGGTPGATATATFIGQTVPFERLTNSTAFTWDNPVVAGDGSLIYPSIHSPDFLTGVRGWSINRSGNAEFLNINVRGTFEIDGGSNAYIKLILNGSDPIMYFQPPDPALTITPGGIIAGGDHSTLYSYLAITSPKDTAQDTSSILLVSAKVAPTFGIPQYVAVFPELKNFNDEMLYLRGQRGTASVTFGAATTNLTSVTFPVAFPAGVVPNVKLNRNNAAAGTARWMSNAININNTGFQIWSEQAQAVASAWAAVAIQWEAVVDHS